MTQVLQRARVSVHSGSARVLSWTTLSVAGLAALLGASAAAAPGAAAQAEAETLFAGRCAPCHGASGAGDGVAAVALTPKPRDLGDATWQASVTDADISKVIAQGGAAVGKSALMPPNPDVAAKPELLEALVLRIRGFARQGAAGTAQAAPATATPPAAVVPAAAVPMASGDEGEQLFRGVCGACHTVGGGVLVGPDLRGVHARRSEDWLRRFVKSSQALVTAGDPTAVELFAQFNSLPMPDSIYTDAQIGTVLAFLKRLDAQGGTFSLVPATPARAATAQEIQHGLELFHGRTRLANGGPACNSCHHVTNDAVIGGGVLAKDLTSVFTRTGGPGVTAILGSPPFPVMERAYAGRPLEADEVFALVGFLQNADAQKAFQTPRDYGLRLFVSGLIGLVVLLGVYALIWGRGKKRCVNQAVSARQVSSS